MSDLQSIIAKKSLIIKKLKFIFPFIIVYVLTAVCLWLFNAVSTVLPDFYSFCRPITSYVFIFIGTFIVIKKLPKIRQILGGFVLIIIVCMINILCADLSVYFLVKEQEALSISFFILIVLVNSAAFTLGSALIILEIRKPLKFSKRIYIAATVYGAINLFFQILLPFMSYNTFRFYAGFLYSHFLFQSLLVVVFVFLLKKENAHLNLQRKINNYEQSKMF